MDTGDLEALAAEINGLIAAWEEFGYADPPGPGCVPVPPLGKRNAAAITAGHQAIDDIDRLTRRLYEVRSRLEDELRQDSDIRGARIDAMLAARKGEHAPESPEVPPI